MYEKILMHEVALYSKIAGLRDREHGGNRTGRKKKGLLLHPVEHGGNLQDDHHQDGHTENKTNDAAYSEGV